MDFFELCTTYIILVWLAKLDNDLSSMATEKLRGAGKFYYRLLYSAHDELRLNYLVNYVFWQWEKLVHLLTVLASKFLGVSSFCFTSCCHRNYRSGYSVWHYLNTLCVWLTLEQESCLFRAWSKNTSCEVSACRF